MSSLREELTRCLQSVSASQREKQPKHSTITFRTVVFTVQLYQVTISQLFQQHALCNDCKWFLPNKIIFQHVSVAASTTLIRGSSLYKPNLRVHNDSFYNAEFELTK
jgi:hypothetical protein